MDHFFDGRAGEDDLFGIIRSMPLIGEEGGGAPDGSEYLNESGEGIELDLNESGDEERSSRDCDVESGVGPAITKSGEVYILSVRLVKLNELSHLPAIYIDEYVSYFRPPQSPKQNEAMPKGWRQMRISPLMSSLQTESRCFPRKTA